MLSSAVQALPAYLIERIAAFVVADWLEERYAGEMETRWLVAITGDLGRRLRTYAACCRAFSASLRGSALAMAARLGGPMLNPVAHSTLSSATRVQCVAHVCFVRRKPHAPVARDRLVVSLQTAMSGVGHRDDRGALHVWLPFAGALGAPCCVAIGPHCAGICVAMCPHQATVTADSSSTDRRSSQLVAWEHCFSMTPDLAAPMTTKHIELYVDVPYDELLAGSVEHAAYCSSARVGSVSEASSRACDQNQPFTTYG